MMEFIAELHEARMTRDSNNNRVLTYTDCCERLYLSLLVLQLLRQYPQFAPYASGYAKKTVDKDNYKHFRAYNTDLYNFAHFVTGDDDAMDKLKDPTSALAKRQRTTLPVMNFNRYLSNLGMGRVSSTDDQQVFARIENAVGITNADYKDIRRNIFNINRLATGDKKKVVTRLLFAVRAKLRSSDIIEYLEKLASVKDLETAKVTDPEPTVSVPDLTVSGGDLALYRYLVGTKNLMMAKKFLELAKDGKSIPQQFVQAYLPAVVTIDNIVKGGPAFISMLRALEKRAKQQHKK